MPKAPKSAPDDTGGKMSDRSLRGMRLGSQSMETESNVQPAPRQRVEYRTADGDRVFVTFAAEAEIPPVWTAKSGKEAFLVNGDSTANAEDEKPARTHWDMLMERRSIEELEKTLEERLEYYRNHFAV
jgi:hypothetical protein